MPTINVTERSVSPRLDQGLLAGLIAGAVVSVWMLLIGALGNGTAADHGAATAALSLGSDSLQDPGFNGNWLIGQIVHLGVFSLVGVAFALIWPKLRRYGVWAPSILFALAVYVVLVQIIARLILPEAARELTGVGIIIGYFIAGLAFAYRYRRA